MTNKFISVVFSLLLLVTAKAGAAELTTLYKITGSGGGDAYQIRMDFSGRPAYRINMKETRIDLFLTKTVLDAKFANLLREDATIAKSMHETWKDNLILSFVLQDAPQKINATLLGDTPDPGNDPARPTAIQLILDVGLEAKPTVSKVTKPTVSKGTKPTRSLLIIESKPLKVPHKPRVSRKPRPTKKAAKVQPSIKPGTAKVSKSSGDTLADSTKPTGGLAETAPVVDQGPFPEGPAAVDDKPSASRPRPVIATRLPGTPMVAGPSLAGRFVSSPFSGRWETFLTEYEVPVKISIPLRYSFPPFPYLALNNPKSVNRIMSAIVVAHGSIGEWEKVLTFLDKSKAKNLTASDQERLELIYAEALTQKGDLSEAADKLIEFINKYPKSTLNSFARHLIILIQAKSGKPYEADYELDKLQGKIAATDPLNPWLNLLKAEIAITTERHENALQLLTSSYTNRPQPARKLYALRRADAWAASGRYNEALEAYRYLRGSDDILKDHPHSLAGFAESLYQLKKYQAATEQYKILTASLSGKPGQDLAFYAQAMSLLRSGGPKQTLPLFQNITATFPGTEGSYRARLKANDIKLLTDIEREGVDTAIEYGNIAAEAPLRELREEAAFKQALALYLKKELLRTTQFLQAFIHDYGSGPLRQHAEALQIELLPATIKDLITSENYLQALILAEQNRDLLISGRITEDFLEKVGQAFAGLNFWNRAIRVYRYMLDIHQGRPGEEKIYLPLIQALYNKEEYKMVEEFADKYLAGYPAGEYRAPIFHLLISAIRKNGLPEKAAALLDGQDYPENKDLNLLAGEIFWDLNKYDKVEKYLARLMDEDLQKAAPSEVFLRAEALYQRGLLLEALPFYQFLAREESYADQANYRNAQIHLDTGKTDKGLNLLQNLTEKGNSPLWRKMAQETLAINKTIRTAR